MGYVPLGSRVGYGVADPTGNNPGNWTIVFDSAAINVNVPVAEIYQIAVEGAPGTTFTVYINSQQWNASNIGELNSWDPNQPMLLRPGDSVYFYYNDPTTDGQPPKATLWLRFDDGIQANMPYATLAK